MPPMRRLWDISPPVSPRSPVYPGDEPYSLRWTARMEADGAPANVSAIALSPHVGAHADAPLHYDDAGLAVGALDLAPFLGRCRVVHAIGCAPLVTVAHLEPAGPDWPPRVLVRTAGRAATAWSEDFAAIAPEAIDWLAERGVVLVGIDTPSVDPASSSALDSHQRLRCRGLRVLENLVLDDVPAGDYELIALPLRLMDAEASPVRAVLREWRE
jgi:arylformamidase